jgi:hypothetical protein
MNRLVIELDDEVSDRLTSRAAAAGYPDAAGFVSSLVTRELGEPDFEALPDGPPHLAIRTEAELAKLLISRLDDDRPSIEATPEFWDDLRAQIERSRSGTQAP